MNLTLSPQFEEMLAPLAVRSEDILKLSSFYHGHAGEPTPWDEDFAVPAYLSYFLPLNYARLRAVLAEVQKTLQPQDVSEIWDFGSGPGTTHWALEDQQGFLPCPLFCVESSTAAMKIHFQLIKRRQKLRFEAEFNPHNRKPKAGALGVFSYSFLEMQPATSRLNEFDHLLIVEPSTREGGRALMEWRQRLLDQGFSVIAPCTHAKPCPLLVESPRDWCHMRVAFSAPEWFLRLEQDLPMKNRTLTYSYLFMSRTVKRPWGDELARVIGDTLEEKGKTRQMICRGPHREFLSWLHRYGEAPRIPHGSLVQGVETCENKGQELRVKPESQLSWTQD